MLSYLLAGATLGPVVSQSFLDLMITLIFVCFIIDYSRNKYAYAPSFRKPFLFEYGFILYPLLIIIGFFVLNITDTESWFRLYKFHWIINFYIFVWAFSRYEINLTKLLKFFSIAYLIPNFYAIAFTIYNNYWSLNPSNPNNTRLLGLLESATYHAHANGLILTFFLTVLFFQFKKLSSNYKTLCILAVLLMAIGIFLTFTRGVWLSLTLTILLFLLLHHRKLFFTVLASGAILISGLYMYSASFRDRVEHSIQTKTADSERWDLFDLHVKLFKDHPVFGIGYFNSLSHTPEATWSHYGYTTENRLNSHAHNQLLNVLSTTGILGLITFSLFYFWFLIINIRLTIKYKTEKLENLYILSVACLMTQLEFLIANLTDVGFEYTKIRSLILLVWALVFCMWQNRVKISLSAPTRS